MDKLLRGLEDPQVLGTAAVLAVGLGLYAYLTVRIFPVCTAARDDCNQVLSLVHRIPGIGGPAQAPDNHVLRYLV